MKPLLATLLLLPVLASADCSLMAGGWSYHLDRTVDWNEEHHMVGIACKRWSAMKFTNSHYRESYGVGYEYPLSRHGSLDFSAYAAVWTGYEDWEYGRPVGGLRARWSIGRFSVVGTTAVEVNTLHLEWRI